MKLWGGRFAKETDALVEKFNSSIGFDKRLYKQDIRGSQAHVKMIAAQGIIDLQDAQVIDEGLEDILAEIEAGTFVFDIKAEDIHMNIEKRLIEKVGPVGGKLHTGRSRNDQVALDTHMYMKEEIKDVASLVLDLQKELSELAEMHVETLMPGYTHLQRAQPISFGHHLMAYFYKLQRDGERLQDCFKRTDLMPLGAGALAGTSFPIDREMVAKELGFAALYENSIDAVSDRDYIVEFLAAASTLMMHLSRLSEEIILWSSAEFGFVELDDAYCTGSSIMPQKKNQDVAELVRGKTGGVFGDLMAMLTTLKGLPLAYNKDMQEDKERLFNVIDTIKISLKLYSGMIATMNVKADHMAAALENDFSNATDMADYLVKKGIPFRECHAIVGKTVLYCIQNDKRLVDLSLAEYKDISSEFAEDILEVIKVRNCMKARKSRGGAAPEAVLFSIEKGRGMMKETEVFWSSK